MFVVVAFVGGVTVSFVHVVEVVAVQDRGVAASAAVHMSVLLGRYVRSGGATGSRCTHAQSERAHPCALPFG
jgi:hypothetical protein